MNKRSYFLYALAVTIVVTIVSWVDMLDSADDAGRWRSGSSRGGSGYYGGSGHK
ncbi:hypothetical protein [Massilia sp. ST3]|uniref:hypothetical protein n=1 Tax=Massilia sp. ST3 TaxID=2824903 RepID=UPI001B81030C|nr:hypothetical protein [Massilia sp. ST3]MBQ5948685.1 hypothetical protein [Massilia sp. ST3]